MTQKTNRYFSAPLWFIIGYVFLAVNTRNNQVMCIYITLLLCVLTVRNT
jgi:hypothetical protein